MLQSAWYNYAVLKGCRAALLALLAIPTLTRAATPIPPAAKLPILLPGATLTEEGKRHKKKGDEYAAEVDLPSRGSWFVWVKASNPGWAPVILTYDLDGVQPLHSSRTRLIIPPDAKSQWFTYTAYARMPGYKMQVNVDTPGKHTLHLKLDTGRVLIEQVALTLWFEAKPTKDGKSLDHSMDPGRGRAAFPETGPRIDGFRDDWTPPALPAAARTFFVDAEKGDDAKDGRTEATAWRSTTRVNAETWLPGDHVLFKRGQTWIGGLAPKGSGTKTQPIVLSAFGTGARPLVNGGLKPGLSLLGQSWWTIQSLAFTVEPDAAEDADAVRIWSGEGPQPKGITVRDVVAFDAAHSGIEIGAEYEHGDGFDGVIVENCLTFANSEDGICVHGYHQNGGRNAVIRNCTAYGNDGMAGMWIQSTQNGLIERCVGYNNACYNIWTWNALNVTIRECEAFRGREPGAYDDRGGFDVDWGCAACTVERCFAHENTGAGFLLMGSGTEDYLGFTETDRYNLCRDNVSVDNGHGILVYNTFEDGVVCHNLAVSHLPEKPALELWGESWGGKYRPFGPSRTVIRDNLLIGTEGSFPLGADATSIGSTVTLDSNLYWRADGRKSLVRWGGTRDDWNDKRIDDWETGRGKRSPTVFASFAEYRTKTGQEPHGLAVNPGFAALAGAENGRLPLAAWRLPAGSPARGAGTPDRLDPKWLEARRALLSDTGAAAYGIPMEPDAEGQTYWGEPASGTRPIGPDR